MSNNYSPICKRCGRKLKSIDSRNRGYGPCCYRKICQENGVEIKKRSKKEKISREKIKDNIDGQINIEEFLNKNNKEDENQCQIQMK